MSETNTPAPGATIATAAVVDAPVVVDAVVTPPVVDPAATLFPDAAAVAKAEADKQAAIDAADPTKVAEAAAAAAKAEADKAAAKAPETYEFKAPEGMVLDPAQVEAFTPVAKELGLTNDQAQKLVDLQVAATTASAKRWTDQVAAWGEEAKADPEFGKQNLGKSTAAVAKALDKFGSPEARKALDDSGMGNHPALLKLFRAVGLAMGEDNFATGNSGGGGTPRTAAEILFPNHPR